jgi:HAE1 family hydrophobic/amphiphilic exporter-1
MNLPQFAVHRPVTTVMIFAAILILGVISLLRLPLELFPDISNPAISVVTSYTGAGAEDVEKQVTDVVEAAVSTVSNVKELRSTSKEGLSLVTLTLNFGANVDEVSNDVRDKLDWVKSYLPADAGTPTLFKFSFSDIPVFFLGVSGTESYGDLYHITDKKVADPLKRIDGVGAVSIYGGLERQINVNLDRDRVAGYNLSTDQIDMALKAASYGQPAGSFKVGALEYMVRVPGDFVSLSQIEDVVVGQNMGKPVKLSDVATVVDGYKDASSRTRVNGNPGLMLIVQKRSGANTVRVSRAVRAELESVKKDLPKDVKLMTIMDTAEFIELSINDLKSTIYWGVFFVILVVVFFLRDFLGSFIITLTLPFSLILGFMFLYLRGYTINMISLSSLAIAIGMVVDDAIVILENVFRHLEWREKSDKAAVDGSTEVGRAVIASTATTVAIFIPLIFIGGIVGLIFKQLALVVMIVLGASLFCALTLTPMLASLIFKKVRSGAGSGEGYQRFLAKSGLWFKNVDVGYRGLLAWALNHRKTVVISAVLIFLFSLVPVFTGMVGSEFFPKMDQGEVRGSIVLPVGTSVDETDSLVRKVEQIAARSVPESKVTMARMGQSEFGFSSIMGEEGPNIGEITIELVKKAQRNRTADQISDSLDKLTRNVPGAKSIEFGTEDAMSQLFFGLTKPITIELYGYDIAETDSIAAAIKEKVEKIPGIVGTTISRKQGKPEVEVRIDRDRAAALGLSVAQIASTLRTSFYGTVSTIYREGGSQYNVFLRLAQPDRRSAPDIRNVLVSTPMGTRVPVSNIATLRDSTGPVEIERKNRERIVTIESGLRGRALGDVARDVKRLLATQKLPEGFTAKLTGSIQEQTSAFRNLFAAFILGMILVYMVMAAQFESFVDPFVIMFSVPFGVVGVIWFLFLTGSTLNMMSFVGLVMLVGIVVKNAIVLVDYAILMRKRGMELHEAVLLTGERRLRPVLMTTLTTICGLIPLALSKGEGSETWNSLAIAVIGGLTVSTLVTLVLVPTVYVMFEERRNRKDNAD